MIRIFFARAFSSVRISKCFLNSIFSEPLFCQRPVLLAHRIIRLLIHETYLEILSESAVHITKQRYDNYKKKLLLKLIINIATRGGK